MNHLLEKCTFQLIFCLISCIICHTKSTWTSLFSIKLIYQHYLLQGLTPENWDEEVRISRIWDKNCIDIMSLLWHWIDATFVNGPNITLSNPGLAGKAFLHFRNNLKPPPSKNTLEFLDNFSSSTIKIQCYHFLLLKDCLETNVPL